MIVRELIEQLNDQHPDESVLIEWTVLEPQTGATFAQQGEPTVKPSEERGTGRRIVLIKAGERL